MTNLEENLLIGTISGVVAGLVVYFIQLFVSKRAEKKEKKEKKKVGEKTDKYIDEDFICNYLPQNLDIDKILEDFGQPIQKIDDTVTIKWDNNRIRELTIYQYKFINAVILFSTFKNESTIISLTINSNYNKSHPVKFSFAFAGKDVYFGQAKINDEIINNKIDFETQSYVNWAFAAIRAKFFYREIKELTFTYVVCDIVDSEKEMKDKIIDQLCISGNEDVYPIIYFYDMI